MDDKVHEHYGAAARQMLRLWAKREARIATLAQPSWQEIADIDEELGIEQARVALYRAESALLDWWREQLARLPEYAAHRRQFNRLLSNASSGAARQQAIRLLISLRVNPHVEPSNGQWYLDSPEWGTGRTNDEAARTKARIAA